MSAPFAAPVVELDVGPRRPPPLRQRPGPRRAGLADRHPGRRGRPRRHARRRAGRARCGLRPHPHRLPARRAGARPATCSPCTSARATRCSTSAPSRTTPRPTPRATCCSRARSADAARSVYTGLIQRADGGAGAPTPSRPTATSSCPTHAWAESVPNLEIENNDVRCSHASTVGPGRRGAALLPREPGRAAGGGRAADRRRVLRRGARSGCRSPSRAPSRCGPRSVERLSRREVA